MNANSRVLKGFLSVSVYGAIFTKIAPGLGYFWWTGTIAGFIVGYLTCEWKELARAIRTAYHSVVGWQSDKSWNWWKAYGRLIWSNIVSVLNLFLIFVIGGYLVVGAMEITHFVNDQEINLYLDMLVFAGFLGVALGGTLFMTAIMVVNAKVFSWDEKKLQRETKENYETAKSFSPIRFYIFGIPWLFQKALPFIITKLGEFVILVLTLIHSDRRMVRGFSVAFGVAVGYYETSWIVGGIFAGVFVVIGEKLIGEEILGVLPKKAA